VIILKTIFNREGGRVWTGFFWPWIGWSGAAGFSWPTKQVSVSVCQEESGTCSPVAYPGILFGGGGVQQIQLRTEDRENGDLGAVAP
jgi:hypothetical protein